MIRTIQALLTHFAVLMVLMMIPVVQAHDSTESGGSPELGATVAIFQDETRHCVLRSRQNWSIVAHAHFTVRHRGSGLSYTKRIVDSRIIKEESHFVWPVWDAKTSHTDTHVNVWFIGFDLSQRTCSVYK